MPAPQTIAYGREGHKAFLKKNYSFEGSEWWRVFLFVLVHNVKNVLYTLLRKKTLYAFTSSTHTIIEVINFWCHKGHWEHFQVSDPQPVVGSALWTCRLIAPLAYKMEDPSNALILQSINHDPLPFKRLTEIKISFSTATWPRGQQKMKAIHTTTK